MESVAATLTKERRRAIGDGLTLVGILGIVWEFIRTVAQHGGADQPAYWGFSFDTLYQGAVVGGPAARLYSPAFFQVISPLSNLPYVWFVAVWAAMALAALLWLMRLGPWLGVAIIWVAIVGEIQGGNIHMLMAAAIVLGFRFPEAWSFLLLTKILPGVGVLWFALRGEWRSFARALIATAIIAAVSAILAPGLWADWIRLLAAHPAATGMFGLPIRLVLAGVLLVWGARTDRRWTVPIAAVLASPLLEVAPSMLVACIPLARQGRSEPARGAGAASRASP